MTAVVVVVVVVVAVVVVVVVVVVVIVVDVVGHEFQMTTMVPLRGRNEVTVALVSSLVGRPVRRP